MGELEKLESEVSFLMAFHDSCPGPKHNFKVFYCPTCKRSEPLMHFLTSPKCWRAIQRKINRKFEKLPPAEQERFTNTEPEWGPYCMECMDCLKPIYWDNFWPVRGYRCPKCYARHRRNRRNELARKRYEVESGRCKIIEVTSTHGAYSIVVRADAPRCQHCGDSFEAKRKDARFCSARCRVAAMRKRKVEQDKPPEEMKSQPIPQNAKPHTMRARFKPSPNGQEGRASAEKLQLRLSKEGKNEPTAEGKNGDCT